MRGIVQGYLCVTLNTSTGCDSCLITTGWHSWALLPLYMDYGTKILHSPLGCGMTQAVSL